MYKRLYHHIRALLFPCLILAVSTGVLSALTVTAFKLLAEWGVHLSLSVYGAVREEPIWLPLLLLGAALLGLIASGILSLSHSCKGGGIPTSVAAIRGFLSFRWLRNIILLPFSALLSFLVGVPLGTEGPCVQMGTAVGDGVVKCIGRERHRGWRRYIMTGGASAGFSIATASPISAIVFSMEELHKHFSPLLLSVVAVSVLSAQAVAQLLALFGIGSTAFFEVSKVEALPPALLFAPILVGLAAGCASILFTRLYHLIDHIMHFLLKRFSRRILLPILFAALALVGFFFAEALGTGHSLVEALFTDVTAWYVLLLIFLVRAVGMILSNTSGATGGIFLPTLAFGAIIGALAAKVMIAFGWIAPEQYLLMVILGIVSFLGATSRIPLTACIFAVEALGGISNALPIVIAITVALLTAEASGLEDFTDTIIAAKLRKITKGKRAFVIEAPLTVTEESFAVGKELRDVLWPNSCVVVSFQRPEGARSGHSIAAGDIITVHYTTYDPATTIAELHALVGPQSEETLKLLSPN